MSDFLANQPQSRPRFLQMFAHFVDQRIAGLLLAGRDRNRAFDLFAANPAQIIAEGLTMFQFVAHPIRGPVSHCCRSEERRVGKECRVWWWRWSVKKDT